MLWAAPAQVFLTTILAGSLALMAGIGIAGAALIGLSVAMSSSVVVINITRSRRRTTNGPTEEALLSWSVLQDMTGVAVALLVLAAFRLTARPPLLAAALIAGFVVAGVGCRLGPAPGARACAGGA